VIRASALIILLWVLRVNALAAADPLAARVVVLANSDDPDSLRVARHYCDARQVPVENIVAVPMPLVETITWSDFVARIWRPVQAELIARKWLDGIPMNTRDEAGRQKCAFGGHRIAFLVVCRGVPLRIDHDPALYHPHPPITDNPYFQTNAAAVDSELSLLAVNDSPVNAFLVNPLFRNDRPEYADLAKVVKVSRLDGPTADDAMALVDHALVAERRGLVGRAYVDIGGIHPDGDRWLTTTAAELRDLGFDLDVDEHPSTMPSTARIDAPALYFGWYARSLNGPFALPGFRFPPGAIAVHIHSESATTLRSASDGWAGPLIARGVTATVGNVFEPYLQLLHRPDLLLRALARGDRFGDAAYYAEPVLSWQAIAIGDPLYRPFAVSLPELVAARSKMDASDAGYVTVREMRRLERTNRMAESTRFGTKALSEKPSLALAFALSLESEARGESGEAIRQLQVVTKSAHIAPNEWGLVHDVAQFLATRGAPALGTAAFRRLLDDPALPRELRLAWLPEARRAAVSAGQLDQAAAWQSDLSSGSAAPAENSRARR
jgi:uncharacterized protein (TIGR03790 family)